MRAKLFLQWLLVILLFTALFFSFLSVFLSPGKPVRFSEIPQETKDYFNDLIGEIGVDIKFVDFFDKEDWLNENDFGQDSLAGLASIQDSNFIIYYDSTLNSEGEFAVFVMESANLNIIPLTDLFGKYYYPENVNERKLPIYLANSNKRFAETFTKLTGRSTNTQWMAGICITTISGAGLVYTDGIILKTYDESRKPERFLLNLRHEMAHYVHLNSVDWLITYPKIWETEGFAMYFEGAPDELRPLIRQATQRPDKISLTKDVDNYIDSYWVGYSVMLFMEKEYNRQAVAHYIHNNYTLGTEGNIKNSFGLNVHAYERKWKGFVGQYF